LSLRAKELFLELGTHLISRHLTCRLAERVLSELLDKN